MDEEEVPTYKVGDRVKAGDEFFEAEGTVTMVQDTPSGQWLSVEWDGCDIHADQVRPA